jgi:hypothetical protein
VKRLPWRIARRTVKTLDGLLGYGGQWTKQLDCLGYVTNPFWPRSFNEKLLRRKLDPYPPEWVQLADKLRVRDYVAETIGSQHLNELLLVTANPDEIRLAELPSRFVVKPNHGSGWVNLVRDSTLVDEAAIRAQCRTWLGMRYGAKEGERWYDEIPPRILVERFLEGADGEPASDVKFFVFHGRTEVVQVDTDRYKEYRQKSYYDRDWNLLPMRKSRPAGRVIPRPRQLAEMLELAERLAAGQTFVRVDLYCLVDGQIIFGELTLVPGGGVGKFVPQEWDWRLGALW